MCTSLEDLRFHEKYFRRQKQFSRIQEIQENQNLFNHKIFRIIKSFKHQNKLTFFIFQNLLNLLNIEFCNFKLTEF